MNSVESEIIEKFRQLDEQSQVKLLDQLNAEMQSIALPLTQWLSEATTLREQLATKYGSGYIHSQSLLDEVRDEASWPRL